MAANSISKSPPSLMSLPTSIRAKILRHTGLVAPQYHLLDCESDPPLNRGTNPRFYPKLPLGLLRVNRQFFSECAPIFYGENRFMIRVMDDKSQRHLQNLRSTTRELLGTVYILTGGHAHTPVAQARLSWSKLFATLHSVSMRNCCFHISLHLHSFDEELVGAIVADILKLSRICVLNLRVGPVVSIRYRNHTFRRTKEGYVELREHKYQVHKPFPYEKLPPELRLMVLSYTGLVHGYSRVGFSRRDLERPIMFKWPCRSCTMHILFCTVDPGVISSTCACWGSRVLLNKFLVNKQMYHDASIVFFSNNSFLIRAHTSSIVEATQRLESLQVPKLKLIRHLVIKLQGLDPEKWKDWIEFLDLVDHWAHPKLELRIAFRPNCSIAFRPKLDIFVTFLHSLQVNYGVSSHVLDRMTLAWPSDPYTHRVACWKDLIPKSESSQLSS